MSLYNDILSKLLNRLASELPIKDFTTSMMEMHKTAKTELFKPVIDDKKSSLGYLMISNFLEEKFNEYKNTLKVNIKPKVESTIHSGKEAADNILEKGINNFQSFLKASVSMGAELVEQYIDNAELKTINQVATDKINNIIDASGEASIKYLKTLTKLGEEKLTAQFDQVYDIAIEAISNPYELKDLITGNIDLFGDIKLDEAAFGL